MSQAPSMPLFCGDYLKDTADLTPEEHGAYLLILMYTWANGCKPMPDDDERIARRLRISKDRWAKKIRPTLEPFFDLSGGSWRSPRLEREWEYVSGYITKQSEKGKASAEKREKARGKNQNHPKDFPEQNSENRDDNSLKNNDTISTAVGQRLQPQGQPELNTHPHPQSKKDTEAKASGANAANEPQVSRAVVIDLFPVEQTPAQMMWGTYLHELADMTGKSPKDASLRKLLGQWSKAYGGEQAVCEAISDASARQPPLADPVPWIIATLKTRKNGNERNRPQKRNSGWFEFGCELAQGGIG